MPWSHRFRVAALCLVLLGPFAWAASPVMLSTDEQTLRAAKQDISGPALLEFFRRRTVAAEDWDRMKALVQQLGDNSFQAREKASTDLKALGVVTVPLLRQAVKDPDLEIVRRAEECLRVIEDRDPGSPLAGAAARVLAQHKTPGAVPVLLAYAPFADDELVAKEIRTTLTTLVEYESNAVPMIVGALGSPWLATSRACLSNSVENTLVTALEDKTAARRLAAAEALCQAGLTQYAPALRKLLADGDPQVRLHIGLALARTGDKDAIPVLIELLAQLPQGEARSAESLLVHLAEDQAPAVPLGQHDNSRRQCRDAWMGWWQTHQGSDLSKLREAPQVIGYTLLVLLDLGRVLELDAQGRVRWQIDGLEFPLDAQILPGDRLLVAEHAANRVTERNHKGEILWQHKIEGPLVAQRLPNGNTFIATQINFVEVNRNGRDVMGPLNPPQGEFIMKAEKLSNREIALVTAAPGVTAQARFLRIDPTNNHEPKGFPVNVRTYGGRIEVLPNGHVIVPEKDDNRVVEYNADGKVVWAALLSQPVAAVRLPNGNTLVTSMNENRAVELDRTGKNEVWQYKAESKVTRAFRR